MFCLFLAAMTVVPNILPAGNVTVVKAAKKSTKSKKKNGLVREKGNYRYYDVRPTGSR